MKPTDCRSDEGVLVGLIDGMISQSRVIARALREGARGEALREALADIASDEDVHLVTRAALSDAAS